MIGTLELLKADHIGIREFKNKASEYVQRKASVIVTDRGKPRKVLVSYGEMISLLETLADLMNEPARKAISHGRKVIEGGSKGSPAKEFFKSRVKRE